MMNRDMSLAVPLFFNVKGKIMLKRFLLIVIVCLSLVLVVRAQDATPTLTSETPARREIYTALAYGDVLESDLWIASANEDVARTTATFRSDKLGAVAYVDYLHFDKGLKAEEVDAVFNDAWFKGTLANYDAWRRIVTCKLEGDVTLHEFNVEKSQNKYAMRYWIQPVSQTRTVAIFLVFPISDTGNMDAYAQRLFPDASTCAK
jgi:hypothetical protein